MYRTGLLNRKMGKLFRTSYVFYVLFKVRAYHLPKCDLKGPWLPIRARSTADKNRSGFFKNKLSFGKGRCPVAPLFHLSDRWMKVFVSCSGRQSRGRTGRAEKGKKFSTKSPLFGTPVAGEGERDGGGGGGSNGGGGPFF